MPSGLELNTEIRAHGFDDTADPSDTRIYLLLTVEHNRLCRSYPWPFTEATSSWTETQVPGNTPFLAQAPTDIAAVRGLALPTFNYSLSYVRRDTIEKTYGMYQINLIDVNTIHYYLYGGRVGVWPYINVNTPFILDYFKKPAAIAEPGKGTPRKLHE